MPSNNCIRLHQEHCARPSLGAARQLDQTDAIPRGELGLLDLPTEQNYLLTQKLVLNDELLAGTKTVSQCTKAKAGVRLSSGSYPVLKKPTEAAETTAESFVEFPVH
ncbi:MAG: hypothetical protein ACI91F_002110 [Candidatus Binatia bacterium]|jgi:hypothetical protein